MDTQENPKKREFYNRPWFWIIVGVVVLTAIGSSNNSNPSGAETSQPTVQTSEETAPASAVSKPAEQSAQKTSASAKTSNAPVQQPQQSQQTYTTPSGAVVNNNGNTVASPPAPAATWHTVATFSGNADTNTNDFSIKGSKWRIDWSFSFPPTNASYCQQYGCNMAVQVFQDDSTYVDQFLQEGQQPSNGIVYEYGKPTGNMYLHVVGGNVSWTLTIEDYY
jgi:hypothetical protein